MIKIYTFSFMSFLLFSTISHGKSDNSPKEKLSSETGISIRLFKKYSFFSLLFDSKFSKRYEKQSFSHFKVGSYLKIDRGVQLGMFFTEALGLRHQDDWKKRRSGFWGWGDSSRRKEYLININVEKRIRFNQLSSNIFGIKVDFQRNFFNEQNIIFIEPSWHYFFLEKGEPLWSIRAKATFYDALNFDVAGLYKRGLYMSLIKNINRNFLISLDYLNLKEVWSQSKKSKESNQTAYSSHDITNELTVNLVYYL